VIVEFADGAPEDELRALPGVQTVEQQTNGTYHLKLAGSIDPVIKVLARHTIRRLEVEEAPLEDVFLKFYTGDTTDASEHAQRAEHAGAPISPVATQEGRPL
jgi:hypothetical protein